MTLIINVNFQVYMVAFLIVGIVLIFTGIWIQRKKKKLQEHGRRVKGVIVGNRECSINDRSLFFPMVEIENEQQEKLHLKMTIGTNVGRRIGSPIEIVYDPYNPSSDVFEYTKSTPVTSLLFIILGAIFTFIGAVSVTLVLVWEGILKSLGK